MLFEHLPNLFFSDEHPENCLLCGVDNGHCPQLCLPTPHGPVCQCKEGFSLVSVNRTVDCLDKDEYSLLPKLRSNRLVVSEYEVPKVLVSQECTLFLRHPVGG